MYHEVVCAPAEYTSERVDCSESLREEAMEMRRLLLGLNTRFRASEEKREALERAAEDLLRANETLQQQCMEAEKRRILSEKEAGELQEKVIQLSKALSRANTFGSGEAKEVGGRISAVTSTTGLPAGSKEEEPTRKRNKQPIRCLQEESSGSILITQQELESLDEDMRELRSALEAREEAWSRASKRERSQRLRMSHMASELRALRNRHNWKANELEYKSRELKSKIQELASAKMEINNLKAKLIINRPRKEFKPKKLEPSRMMIKERRNHSSKTLAKLTAKDARYDFYNDYSMPVSGE